MNRLSQSTINSKLKIITLLMLLTLNFSFENTHSPKLAKFEPKDGDCLVFIGQDLEAIGGMKTYDNGYCDAFAIPSGVTFYTNFSPGQESYGHYNSGNDGIKTKANWGSGDSCGQYYLDNPLFDNSVFAIGLSMVNHEKRVAKGEHDHLIKDLALWIKSTKRPVFLRIGYEFDGWDWNHYKRKPYLNAWKRIHSIFKTLEVNNVAFVWQSKGNGTDKKTLQAWYPGDEIVDWCAYSYFGNPDEEMIHFARQHNKPVFIAEATPVLENDGLFFKAQLKDSVVAKRMWYQWYQPFFETINNNKDVVKAFSYINANWPSQPMWINEPTFQNVDARIQVSPFVSKQWTDELAKPNYIKAQNDLFVYLGYTN